MIVYFSGRNKKLLFNKQLILIYPLTLIRHNSFSLNLKKKKWTHGEKVIINDHPVKEVNYTKFLGLYNDENLSWKYHISHVTMKMSKMTGILAKARHYLPLKMLQMLYMTKI